MVEGHSNLGDNLGITYKVSPESPYHSPPRVLNSTIRRVTTFRIEPRGRDRESGNIIRLGVGCKRERLKFYTTMKSFEDLFDRCNVPMWTHGIRRRARLLRRGQPSISMGRN